MHVQGLEMHQDMRDKNSASLCNLYCALHGKHTTCIQMVRCYPSELTLSMQAYYMVKYGIHQSVHLLQQQMHTLVDISTTGDDRNMLQLLKYVTCN